MDKARARALLVAALIVLAVASCGAEEPPKGHLVSEVYTVVSGDTLDEISYKFMAKSSVRRDVREFREGVIETNWELLKDRPHGMICAGDKLVINYYQKGE
jgi:hypothetical protein